jgi:streptogramin lyase
VAVDGTGAAARFASPSNIVADAAGNWYVTDTAAHAIRKVTATGVVTTFAGLLGTAGNAVGSGTTARFNAPVGMTIGSDGTLYVADRDRLSKITAAGVVSTLCTRSRGGRQGSPSMISPDLWTRSTPATHASPNWRASSSRLSSRFAC